MILIKNEDITIKKMTITLGELLKIANKLELTEIKTKWYKLEAELEKQIIASFPNPGDNEKIRQLVMGDIGRDNLGINAHLIDDEIYIDYPTVILAAKNSNKFIRTI
jgi:hypothetical protein